MSYVEPHKLEDGVLHCPRSGVGNRVKPLTHDSHQYLCPSCGARLVLKERPVVTVLREVVEITPPRQAVAQ